MLYWEIFLAFFIPGIVGYGGGPPSIPLIQNEVVNRFGWMTNAEFGEVLALGNSLPGPIATKMAGYIGYIVGGPLGAVTALLATVAPSLIAMLILMSILVKYKDSPRVKKMTQWITPSIAVLLALLALQFFSGASSQIGWVHTGILTVSALALLTKGKIHPAWVIAGSCVYGLLLPIR